MHLYKAAVSQTAQARYGFLHIPEIEVSNLVQGNMWEAL